ncbi:hypothetical protein IF1G_04172 [Cordyceps javanica]|uniref:Uncharacterized protein n=1 Tax=Cordyceps javanica TaxID=43265 RepID=A0A545V5D9_9HYPO|nr:hypothetical protein IF1G_04172 [Cordyceps javanica]
MMAELPRRIPGEPVIQASSRRRPVTGPNGNAEAPQNIQKCLNMPLYCNGPQDHNWGDSGSLGMGSLGRAALL